MVKIIDFNEMIENYLKRENKPKMIGRYYPSEIGSCIRKLWYSYKYPQETDIDLVKIFEMGNIIHDFISKVMESDKNPHVELVAKELPLTLDMKDFIVSGRIDDVLLLKENGKKFLVEVKSTKNLEMATEPNRSHVMQLQLYMHATGIEEGMILYVDKNNLKSKAFEVKYSKEEAEEVIKRFIELNICLITDQLPFSEARRDPSMMWMCRFCDYNDKCERNEK